MIACQQRSCFPASGHARFSVLTVWLPKQKVWQTARFLDGDIRLQHSAVTSDLSCWMIASHYRHCTHPNCVRVLCHLTCRWGGQACFVHTSSHCTCTHGLRRSLVDVMHWVALDCMHQLYR